MFIYHIYMYIMACHYVRKFVFWCENFQKHMFLIFILCYHSTTLVKMRESRLSQKTAWVEHTPDRPAVYEVLILCIQWMSVSVYWGDIAPIENVSPPRGMGGKPSAYH